MRVLTDRDSQKSFAYDKWQKVWEWDLFEIKFWSPYEIDSPIYVKEQPTVETANVLVGALILEDISFKRVEVYEGLVYYVQPNHRSLPAKVFLDKEVGQTWF